MDLAFVLDGSGSIDATDFALQKTSLRTAINDVGLFPRDGSFRLAIIQFAGGTPRLELSLTAVTQANLASISSLIDGISQIAGGTNTGDGVNAAAMHLAGRMAERPTATRVICVSTDGTVNNGVRFSAAAANARSLGISALGVIGIRCPGDFERSDLDREYAQHVFGGAAAIFLEGGASEFALTIGTSCTGAPAKLVGFEINQAVQTWKNSVTLIAGKQTFARAFVEISDPNFVGRTRFSARLRGYRNGVELSKSPLYAEPISIGTNVDARRWDWDSSLNFTIPMEWTSGEVEFRLETNSTALSCDQTPVGVGAMCDPQRGYIIKRRFEVTATLPVTFIGMRYKNARGVDVPAPETNSLEKALRSMYPIGLNASIRHTTGTLSTTNGTTTQSQILSAVSAYRNYNLCFSVLGCDRIFYGAIGLPSLSAPILPPSSTGGIVLGSAYCDSVQGWGYVIAADSPRGRTTITHAHEIAHSLGVGHAAGACNAAACGQNCSCTESPGYVRSGTTALLGPVSPSSDAVFGLDTMPEDAADPLPVDPNDTFALMGYCDATGRSSGAQSNRSWVAANEYEYLRNRINQRYGSGPSLLQQVFRYILVRAVVDSATGQATFFPVQEFESIEPLPPQDQGELTLDLLGAGGAVLRTAMVSLQRPHEQARPGRGAAPQDFFEAVLPVEAAATALRLSRGAQVIRTVTASANAPTGRFTFPAGGERLDGRQIVMWNAADADRDTLFTTLQYSRDDGVSWDTIGVDLRGNSAPIDLSTLPGSARARLRAMISDGFRSVLVESEAFSVPDHAPRARITSPGLGEEFFSLETVILTADVSDLEDESVPDGSVRWSSSLDGALGFGRQLVLSALALTEGEHVLEVQVSDSAGNTAVDRLHIRVTRVYQTRDKLENACAFGRPRSLTMIYTGAACGGVNGQNPRRARCTSLLNMDLPSTVRIVVNDNPKRSDVGVVWFDGMVTRGQALTIDSFSRNRAFLNPLTVVHVLDALTGLPLQRAQFDTSCVQALRRGDQFGAVLIDDAEGTNEPIPGDVCVAGSTGLTRLKLLYSIAPCAATKNFQATLRSPCRDVAATLPPRAFVVVSSTASTSRGTLWFQGFVSDGQEFVFNTTPGTTTKFGPTLFLSVLDGPGGKLLQRTSLISTCKRPVVVGDRYGSFVVVEGSP